MRWNKMKKLQDTMLKECNLAEKKYFPRQKVQKAEKKIMTEK